MLAYGAAAHRNLGVPGEEVAGVHAARELVEWYNGHPHATEASFDLAGCETALIVGGGNVALDCARMLTKSVDELARHDVTDYALAALSRSAVRQVVLLGRRGVLQAAFTIKELRDLTKLAGVACTPSSQISPLYLRCISPASPMYRWRAPSRRPLTRSTRRCWPPPRRIALARGWST